MQVIQAINPETSTGKTKELFNAVQSKLGMVPNLMRTLGNSPAALNAYLSFSGALNESVIGAKLGQQIAITVANANACEYCNSAHTFIGENMVKMDQETLTLAKSGKANDAKSEAALTFVRILIQKKGKLNQADIDIVKSAGYSDAAIAEIIAHTALNIFTNYFNNSMMVELDFPKSELNKVAYIA